ncbi:MAG: succinate dehydrogenase assembly factor 2 [Rickettsiales bacterium]|nr:succinate dehydrogenase assembly factor 2 [Rickettsiales bacterium]
MSLVFDEDRIKKTLYRSNHRGCKETDILIGKYANKKIRDFSKAKYILFEELLDEDDWDIYNWIVGKSLAPKKYSDLINEIIDFNDASFRP